MIELHTPEQAAQWLHGHVQGELQTDSRQVGPGDGFIAWPGAATDGRQYAGAALSQGAAACLVEREGVEQLSLAREQVATYAGLKAASGPIAAAYYEQPSRQLDVLAVTGTNGKTSTSWWLAQALSGLKPPMPCGLIGTLGVGRAPLPGEAPASATVVSTGLTTPDPVLLQKTLRSFVDEGMQACAMEASSIGIVERRLDGTQLCTAIFTNFTQDHLDYHSSMQAYWQAKAALFEWPDLRAAVINIDDAKGRELAQTLKERPLALWTISCRVDARARLYARDIVLGDQGMRFKVCEDGSEILLATPLIGEYNVANLLCVIAGLRTLDVPLAGAVQACETLHPVPGRMEFIARHGQPLAVVDYAHTPDALAQVLKALKPLATQRGGRLWCVFGCGGDRDANKRPQMGAAAEGIADAVVLTSDNPRSENPARIIEQIRAGLKKHGDLRVESDRARAIAQTLQQAGDRDVVLVAGKGHEEFQEIAGQKIPFSDRQQVQQALQLRTAGVQA